MVGQTRSRAHWRSRMEDLVFTLLVLVAATLALWLGERHHREWDWTAAARNTLSAPSVELLGRIQGTLRIEAYARPDGVARKGVEQLVARYQRVRPGIRLEFVNPDREPARTRAAGVTADGELVVYHGQRSEHVLQLTERELTNALRRATRTGDRFVAYLRGHGERDLLGRANHDLGDFGERLQERGFVVQPLDLAALGAVPDNTAVLVVTTPESGLLPRELVALERWVEDGGRVLWLADPRGAARLAPLARHLGVTLVPGVVVDPTAGIGGHPGFVPATRYPRHPALTRFAQTTLWVTAAGIDVEPPPGWSVQPLVESGLRSWAERGTIDSPHRNAESERGGPLALAVALERTLDGTTQRVVVSGDGDLLANAYLGNGANLELGLRFIDWLSGDDDLVDIPPLRAPDLELELTAAAALTLAFIAILGLPALLLGAGLLRWRWRRRR